MWGKSGDQKLVDSQQEVTEASAATVNK